MDYGLTGSVAVVPGGTSGLGLATARALAAEGARVAIGGRRGDLAAELAASLPAAIGVGVDIMDPSGPAALVEAAREAFGPVDVLVLNGGGPPPGSAAELTVDDATASVERLLLPHIRLVEAVLPGMRERGWGRIVAIGSSGIQSPIDGLAASNTGRAALAGYLKSLASEVAADGVTANLVLPGKIRTDRLVSLNEAAAARQGVDVTEVDAASKANIPAGRFGTPDEFGAVVTFLASRAASYVTGTQIRCDGGLVRTH
ncbi:SDR family oxidoreductase [Prauserella cavernicola]|uniref:SDR family oxidoreductase n=1 Tax=Prauserella cavernicola TaxID=2800127 RepID=A0A934QTI9_9PSEU|nr:SDR family oxidoreductase [Prauserella cavernicola]MBK1786003.1 SDR family oxidoreductase [Prauserella cavernicola]